MNTGADLRKRRLAAGLSQVRLAEKLSVTQATISNWEVGKSEPDADEQQKLSSILGGSEATGQGDVDEGAGLFGEWLREARSAANMTVTELSTASGVSTVQILNLEAGRSTNPRETTRARLEKALKAEVPKDVREEVAQEQAIEGLGPLSDFDPHDPKDRPTCPGVYVFYDVSDRPIYVGKAKIIKSRVDDHEEKFWFKYPIVSHAAYIEIKDPSLRHQVEQVLIKFLKSNAVINKQSVDRE